MGIFLERAYCPKQGIGVVHTRHLHHAGMSGKEMAYLFYCRLVDNRLPVFGAVYVQRAGGGGEESCTCLGVIPRIAAQQVAPVALAFVELTCRVLQAGEHVLAGNTARHLFLPSGFQRAGLHLRDAGSKNHALAFLHRQLEVAGHQQVFLEFEAALLLFRVLNALVPLRVVLVIHRLRELHE